MKLKKAPQLKQTSLFPTENNLVDDLSKKFPGISRWQIQRTLEEIESFFKNRASRNYSHKHLKQMTEVALRRFAYELGQKKGRSEITGLLQKSSPKIVPRVSDYKSAAANDDTCRD
ncbi:MAG: hypothetical protein ABIE14_01335 [Patescibacteria group bacterium]